MTGVPRWPSPIPCSPRLLDRSGRRSPRRGRRDGAVSTHRHARPRAPRSRTPYREALLQPALSCRRPLMSPNEDANAIDAKTIVELIRAQNWKDGALLVEETDAIRLVATALRVAQDRGVID